MPFPTDVKTVEKVFELTKEGLNGKQAAAKLGISEARVSAIKKSKKFLELVEPGCGVLIQMHKTKNRALNKLRENIVSTELDILIDPVRKLIAEHSLPAAEKLVERMQKSKSDTTELDAAREILDRAGYAVEKKVTTRTIELSSEDAEKIAQAFKYTETRTREVG